MTKRPVIKDQQKQKEGAKQIGLKRKIGQVENRQLGKHRSTGDCKPHGMRQEIRQIVWLKDKQPTRELTVIM